MIPTLTITWLVATTCMTTFSYLFSTLLNENFKEPQLLTDLLGEIISKDLPVWIGWVAHYLTGILFLGMLITAYAVSKVEVSVLWGIFFGMLMGGIGIMIWKGLYQWAQKDPPTHTRLFHLQLIVAHIIFGMAAIGMDRWYAPILSIWTAS